MTVSSSIRQLVKERASNSCEYCLSHQEYVLGRLQVDHIVPRSQGGTDNADNLCLACELCNQYKWTQTDGFDSQSNQYVPIFNPRLQHWQEHFSWNSEGTEIIGLTACGRATVQALRLNNKLAVIVRRNWVQAGWHPPDMSKNE